MMTKEPSITVLPYGSWPSGVSAKDLTTRTINDVSCDGATTWWVEALPDDDGYVSLMRRRDGVVDRPLPRISADVEPFIGTKVYEYGGRAYDVRDGNVVFSSAVTQQVFVWREGDNSLRALTELNSDWRFADFVWHPFDDVVFAVMEDHTDASSVMDVKHRLVSLSFADDGYATIDVIFGDSDFVSSPAVSPDGKFLAFVAWDAPAMPWTQTRLLITELAHLPREIHTVVDADNVAVCHPMWTEDGDLLHIDDASGWDSIYRTEGIVRPHPHDNPHLNWYHRMRTRALNPAPSDFAPLLWQLGRQSFSVFDTEFILASWIDNGERHLGTIRLDNGEREPLPIDWQAHNTMDCDEGRCVLVAHKNDTLPSLVELEQGRVSVVRGGEQPLDSQSVSEPEYLTWPTADGQQAHGIFYRPRLAGVTGPDDEKPPLIVFVHGGPTSMAMSDKLLDYHFWTTRGFAVLVVNYRGSTGFGREYQDALNGYWGIRDVSDTRDGVAFVVDRGDVDPARVAIRGGSAGGFTTLSALATTDVFSAGCSLYGVADLRLLDAQTHKFEANYLPALIGATSDDDPVWDERSPINLVDKINAPLLLLQGEDDPIVPPNQAKLIADKLRERGADVQLVTYPNEGHGFMHDHARIDALEQELAFYRRVWGI